MSQPVLVFSEYCNHSLKFIEILNKHPNIGKKLVLLNIDVDPKTNSRPPAFYHLQKTIGRQISEVPTLILDDEKARYILAGEEAFKWLEAEVNKSAPKSLQGFNPNEMGSFSDSYAPLSGQMYDARDQSFKFIHKPDESITTPQETSSGISTDDYQRKQKEREQDFIQQRSVAQLGTGVPNVFPGTQSTTPMNPKDKDMDARLRQLELDRQNM